MSENCLQTLSIGEAQVTVITLALLRWDLATEMLVPPDGRPACYAHLFEQPSVVPVRCMHVRLPGISLLVDACTSTATEGTKYELLATPVYPDLLKQLASVGISPEDITHVVITHPHFDHIIGLTRRQKETFVPCFPRARHYLGRADWESLKVQETLAQPNSLASQTLGVLQRLKLLELVDGDQELEHGLSILHMPGETPGHQILRLKVGEQTLYHLGDLYHHQVEVEQPTWMASWVDRSTMLLSRQRFSQAALAEGALLVATHIPTIGSLCTIAEGVRWDTSKFA